MLMADPGLTQPLSIVFFSNMNERKIVLMHRFLNDNQRGHFLISDMAQAGEWILLSETAYVMFHGCLKEEIPVSSSNEFSELLR
jgi:hypothetical protein